MTAEERQALIARARDTRLRMMSSLAGAAMRALRARLLGIHRAWMTQRTRTELHALSDRTLRDIGVSTVTIDGVAETGQTPSRRTLTAS